MKGLEFFVVCKVDVNVNSCLVLLGEFILLLLLLVEFLKSIVDIIFGQKVGFFVDFVVILDVFIIGFDGSGGFIFLVLFGVWLFQSLVFVIVLYFIF